MPGSSFSLTSKFAVASGVLLLLSFGLCGAGATVQGTFSNVAVTAGLTCLGLACLGFVITFFLMIVAAAKNRGSAGPNPYQPGSNPYQQPLPPPAAPLPPPPARPDDQP